MKSEDISRRSFLKRALALSAATAIPSVLDPFEGWCNAWCTVR